MLIVFLAEWCQAQAHLKLELDKAKILSKTKKLIQRNLAEKPVAKNTKPNFDILVMIYSAAYTVKMSWHVASFAQLDNFKAWFLRVIFWNPEYYS